MKKIMIVDDAIFMRSTLKRIIEANFDSSATIEAGDGDECINLYTKTKPDMVLMDITMPTMNGITATKLIKEIDENAKIIIISAIGQQQFVLDAIEAGALNFIVKPFSEEKVVSCIQKYL